MKRQCSYNGRQFFDTRIKGNPIVVWGKFNRWINDLGYEPVGKPGADLVVSGYSFLQPSESIVSSDQLSTKKYCLVTIIRIQTFPYITLCHLQHPAAAEELQKIVRQAYQVPLG